MGGGGREGFAVLTMDSGCSRCVMGKLLPKFGFASAGQLANDGNSVLHVG